ncbi:hemoglobin/transferrin/lactoferrin receptor protein [Reichenbachiella faecimaris]|uniref:Hemoglobin/transferrin/lactoferrin receptor protein n=1 Tax=Reichenbachiella faecimaris TaxID=692418 RepID=A0A1W2GJV3_REIFA|nr:TonB-dependent receptor [Reichenbachiella faecimaris]SMD36930.1 hemoglobin/transferrin/lactoferrin receptor protein [Reichenbachiella faecimaris]
MKNIYLLWLLLGVCILAKAQTITIKDKESQLPIELVTLSSTKPSAYATTNAKGQADVSAFKNAEKIVIRTLGHKPVAQSYEELVSGDLVVFLEHSNLNLDEVVISGTRWNQISSNVPSKIVSIGAEALKLQNPQTAADLLSLSGKVYVQKSQQGGGSPMIRGFATNRLLYTVDGVRMNTAIFRGGNIQNVINLDPFATENTEVLFGPGSVIYGSDAVGGVMSFQTLTPQLSLTDKPLISGKALTRYSSANNEKTGHFDVNVGFKKWALVSSISYWDYDDLRQGSHGPDDYLKTYHVERADSVDHVISQSDPLLQVPSAYSQINFMQKVRFKPNQNWDFQYGFHYSETSNYGRYDRHNRTRNGTARYAEWNYGPQKWMMNNLNVTHSGNNSLYDQMTVRLAHQAFEESRIDRSLNSDERTTNSEEVAAYSINLDFVKVMNTKHKLFYGAEYVLDDVTSTGMLTDISNDTHTIGPARYPQSTWASMAVYVNDEYSVSEQFTVQGGLRYNHFKLDAAFDNAFYPFPFEEANLNNGALTGSLGGVYRPSDSWVISTNFGTAFRSPNVDDIGKVFDSEPGAVTVPNPDLDAEYAYNVDLGVAKVFGDFVKLDVTGYYTILKNALVRRDYQLNGQDSILYDGVLSQVQAMQNAAEANVYGVQLGLEVKLPAGFNFSSDLNFQKGEEELDDGTTSASRHAAPFFGVSRLGFKADKLNLQLYTTYQGEKSFDDLPVSEQGKDEIYAKDADGNNYSPSWYTLNFKAMFQYSEAFTVSAGLENITDQRYRPYSSGLSGPGRNFVFSLAANF